MLLMHELHHAHKPFGGVLGKSGPKIIFILNAPFSYGVPAVIKYRHVITSMCSESEMPSNVVAVKVCCKVLVATACTSSQKQAKADLVPHTLLAHLLCCHH